MAEWTPQTDNAAALAQRDAWTAEADIRKAEAVRFAAGRQSVLRARLGAQLDAAAAQIASPAPGKNA